MASRRPPPQRRLSPLLPPTVLPPPPLLLLLPLLLSPAFGCMSTVLQGGTLSDSELLVPEMLVSSCKCCALCYQQPDCASLSINSATGACRLYRSVPDFRSLRLDEESAMLVRPGRSGHHQFCRFDTDCLEPADRCHGRICTTDPTVTCRDLHETYGGPTDGKFYGSINGTTMKLYCRSTHGMAGWTVIGFFKKGSSGWDRSNILERNIDKPLSEFSILGLTEVLRLSGSEHRFRIRVLGRSSAGQYRGFTGSLPTSQSLIVRSPTEAAAADLHVEEDTNDFVAESRAGGHFRIPWLPETGSSLLSVGNSQPDNTYFRTMINEANSPYLDRAPYDYVQYLIRE